MLNYLGSQLSGFLIIWSLDLSMLSIFWNLDYLAVWVIHISSGFFNFPESHLFKLISAPVQPSLKNPSLFCHLVFKSDMSEMFQNLRQKNSFKLNV